MIAAASTATSALAAFSVESGLGARAAAFIALVALSALAGEAGAQSVARLSKTLPETARFCPSWAEAHERTLASLNNGHPPYAVRWKGCIQLKEGHASRRCSQRR